MLDDLVDAVGKALHSRFSEVTVYSEQVPQNFRKPCFLIRIPQSSQKPQLGKRYLQQYLFEVLYFPQKSNDMQQEYRRILLELYDVLEFIKCSFGLFRSHNMRHEIKDNLLHFFMEFHVIWERDTSPVPYMKKYTLKEKN